MKNDALNVLINELARAQLLLAEALIELEYKGLDPQQKELLAHG